MILNDNEIPPCNPDWRHALHHRFKMDSWRIEDGLLLIAGIWPVDAEIGENPRRSSRYGIVEPPVIYRAGLLAYEAIYSLYGFSPVTGQAISFPIDGRDSPEGHERALIDAGRQLGNIRELWQSGSHPEESYPPDHFVRWALAKGFVPSWIDLWTEFLGTKNRGSDLSKIQEVEGVSGRAEKPLGTKERITLLTIIAALCDYSDIKHQERGAAAQIAKMTDELGAPVTDDTIRKTLAKIPAALESRTK